MIKRSKVTRRLEWTDTQVTQTADGWVLTPDERLRSEVQELVAGVVGMVFSRGEPAPSGFGVIDLDESSQIFVTIDQEDRGEGRFRMMTRVPCESFIELLDEDRSTDLDDSFYLAQGASGAMELWAVNEYDRLPGRLKVRSWTSDLLFRCMYFGWAMVIRLLTGRVRRRLEAVAAAREPQASCLVEDDAYGNLRWESIGNEPVFLAICSDSTHDHRVQAPVGVRVSCAFFVSDGGGKAPEVLARLQTEHADTQWEQREVVGNLRALRIGVVVPVPPELSTESLGAAIASIEAAASAARENADSLGIGSSEVLAGGPAPTSSDEDWREQIAADLAAIVEGGQHGSRLIRHDLLDRPVDGASVVLRDITDEGGSRLLVAALDEAGDLVIRGKDRGPAVSALFGGDITCTEWVRRVEARHLPTLIRHLGGLPGESTLEILARRGDGALEDALLVHHVVPYDDDNWES